MFAWQVTIHTLIFFLGEDTDRDVRVKFYKSIAQGILSLERQKSLLEVKLDHLSPKT